MTILVAGHGVFLPALAALGIAIGYVAGMFGIGGGFLLTPLLHIVFRIPLPIAVGSTVCQQIGTSASAFIRYRQYRHGEPRVDWILLGGSLVGVEAGTRFLHELSGAGLLHSHGHTVPIVTVVLEVAYTLVLGSAIVTTLRGRRRQQPVAGLAAGGPLARVRLAPYVDLPRVGLHHVSGTMLAYIGFATGLLAGMLGVGAGVALLPILLFGYGFSMKDAAGTGILLLFFTVSVGTALHAWHGTVDLRIAMAILAGSSIGVQLGARTTSRVSNRTLELAFSVLLAVTIAALVGDLGAALLGGAE